MLLHAAADGFLVAHLRAAMFHWQAEARFQPIEGNVQMNLPLAGEQKFMRVRIMGEGERGIFLGKLGQRRGQFHLIGAVLGIHRQDKERLERSRPGEVGVFLA